MKAAWEKTTLMLLLSLRPCILNTDLLGKKCPWEQCCHECYGVANRFLIIFKACSPGGEILPGTVILVENPQLRTLWVLGQNLLLFILSNCLPSIYVHTPRPRLLSALAGEDLLALGAVIGQKHSTPSAENERLSAQP